MTAENEHGWVENFVNEMNAQRAAARHSGVSQLKSAIPFLSQLGITSLTMTYDGAGDSGDIDDIIIEGKQTAPKTCEELDEAIKKFPPETKAYEHFSVEKLKEAVFQVLPAGFEINEGSYGEVRIDCENNKIHRTNNERIIETRFYEEDL